MSSKPFVTKMDLELAEVLKEGLIGRGFTLTQPEHTLFMAKKPGVSCTLYTSGKLVVNGKGKEEFIIFYLEPEILKDFSYSHGQDETLSEPHIGSDEAGKGDFFGPLCIAAVYADEEKMQQLRGLGVADSKSMNDKKIHALAREVKKIVVHHIVALFPQKYNELYPQFQNNLNTLLAWGHAAALRQVMGDTGCSHLVIDKFANDHVMERALAKWPTPLEIVQRTGGEADVVVAAASILARDAFVRGLEKLEEEYGMPFPKGASDAVITAGKRFVAEKGREALGRVAKLHFKTARAL